MDWIAEHVERNYRNVAARIAAACDRCGRTPHDVVLVAVTKYAGMDAVETLVELGQRHLGESRPQQLVDRAAALPDDLHWHLIGHLQRNKARRVVPLAGTIHSVDSFRLLESLERLAGELAAAPRLLLEVNVSGEAAKDGFDPASLAAGWERVSACERVAIAGLMTMAPFGDDAEAARPVFRRLRELRDRLRDLTSLPLPELSMGMSGDFEIAIEEGATLVRIGGALFEGC